MRANLLQLPILCFSVGAAAQTPGGRWSIHWQATTVGQAHGTFTSPYEGENSLLPEREFKASLTGTLFVAFRAARYTEFVVDPEVSGGQGLSNVTGMAGFPNGEVTRVATAMPHLYLARGYVRQTLPLGGATQMVEAAANQTTGRVPVNRLTLAAGKVAVTDFFDNNTYSHDPRTQFMNWSLMCNGAWDYPADTRGYTVGVLQDLTLGNWSFRSGTFMEPTTPNGAVFDTNLAHNHGNAGEVEARYQVGGQPGIIRALGYINREHAGTFREALNASPGGVPDIVATRRDGAVKYGVGLNLQQQITQDAGLFARYGWSDGKTESWAFTQIDRTLSGGVSIAGRQWKRPSDRVGVGAVRNYLSGDHRSFWRAAARASSSVTDGSTTGPKRSPRPTTR